MDNRKNIVIKASVFNILATAIMASAKVVAGVLSSSSAMIMDAVSYYSDVLVALVVLVGVVLAHKEADQKHPFGYGRIEYISTMLIALFLLYTGVQSLVGAMQGLIAWMEAPLDYDPSYSAASIFILVLTLVIKYVIGLYLKKKGTQIKSDGLMAAAGSAIKKAQFSFATLFIALLFILTGFSADKILSVVIAIFVLKAGIMLLLKTVGNILGKRIAPELSSQVKKAIASMEGVNGAYDLILHNYGPDNYQGSVHIEVDDAMTLPQLDTLQRKIVNKIYTEYGIILTGIGIYASNSSQQEALDELVRIRALAKEYEVMAVHGFYMNPQEKEISFDVVYSFEHRERKKRFEELKTEIKSRYPEYEITMGMDLNYSD
ncbi:cation diffusion facilitator family transporter [Eubacterium oxidoreducens]|uniref:Cation diffusion facilitator family transporter n=1 Tax=Eubacterium oxidoreducens TaxID=1732 RepID=A0A1G6B4V6_EUBOX|nr:cation diffusion facilitator family transporter [Eubacterium oxidoreducens]SDB15706.1 cation diffusion facilitator family transporter [Eubacterium oxidoreducens]